MSSLSESDKSVSILSRDRYVEPSVMVLPTRAGRSSPPPDHGPEQGQPLRQNRTVGCSQAFQGVSDTRVDASPRPQAHVDPPLGRIVGQYSSPRGWSATFGAQRGARAALSGSPEEPPRDQRATRAALTGSPEVPPREERGVRETMSGSPGVLPRDQRAAQQVLSGSQKVSPRDQRAALQALSSEEVSFQRENRAELLQRNSPTERGQY